VKNYLKCFPMYLYLNTFVFKSICNCILFESLKSINFVFTYISLYLPPCLVTLVLGGFFLNNDEVQRSFHKIPKQYQLNILSMATFCTG